MDTAGRRQVEMEVLDPRPRPRSSCSRWGARGVGDDLVSTDARGPEVAADWVTLRSPETYVRGRRMERFASPDGAVVERRHAYAAPARLALNAWALAGRWTLRNDAAVLDESAGESSIVTHASPSSVRARGRSSTAPRRSCTSAGRPRIGNRRLLGVHLRAHRRPLERRRA
jgi:hypothetical protein